MTILAILVLLQAGWMALAVFRFSQYSKYITVAFAIIAVIMILFVIYRNDSSAYKLGWILLICVAPALGTLMYAFFGNKRPSRRLKSIVDKVSDSHIKELTQREEALENLSGRIKRTVNYVSKEGPYPAWGNTKTKYYSLGDYAFEDMLRDLENAKDFIFLEYFIVEEGSMWNDILEILKKKASQGVDVRLIYDDVGSMRKVPFNFSSTVESYGIKVVIFNPVRPVLNLVYNNRDHRKIMVIDGTIGYCGGFNIADEYVNRVKRFGHWKDSGIRLEGMAVWNLTVMFLNMWNSYRKTDEDYMAYYPAASVLENIAADGVVQPFSDTPLDDENVSENVYMEIINQAEDYVYIFTPYLILDNELLSSLQIAARRGVDVRIVTPGIPDKKIIFRLTRSYYQPLIKAGVKIYQYTPGFIHAKSILSDDKMGIVGTINLDYRSLYLHFECGTLMVGSQALMELKKDCMETFEVSDPIEENEIKTNFIGLMIDGILRVLSPLL